MRNIAWFIVPLLVSFSGISAERTTATGKVVDAATNKPIENATVMVYSAGVKQGFSTFCPTCYVDCGKRAVTLADGTFSIPGLSGDLIFNLLVIREGYSTQFINKVDPDKGAAKEAGLKTRTSPSDPAQVVLGKVVDGHGDPVRDALIEQQGIIFEQGRSFGARDWIDLVAVSNSNGEFEMAYSKPAKSMILQVAPRGMAAKLATLPTGADRKAITVTDGATIRGRLMENGKPMANVELGLTTHTRMSGKILAEIRIGTNEKGEFAITNVPPGRVWYLHGKMDSLASRNLAAEIIECATKDDGQEVNLGDIAVRPAYTLRGTIVLSDGKPAPPNMRVMLYADHVPDFQSLMLAADGSFEFKGVAKGVYSLSPNVRGYQTVDGEPGIEILVEGNVTNMRVMLRPTDARR